MPCNNNKSAIQEARDQLFLDTADGARLSIVSSNIGLDRPILGWPDDKWRAVVKNLGFQRYLSAPILYRILEVSFGPQFARVGNLAVAAAVGDTEITLNDASTLIQTGTLVLDAGLTTEEVVEYSYVDRTTNEVCLKSALKFAHNAVADSTSVLAQDATAGATSLILFDSSLFPTSGFPYTILLDRGTENEEAVKVTANTVGTNTLTCVATTKDHRGFKSGFLKKNLNTTPATSIKAGNVFLPFGVDATRSFPASGFVRLNKGGGSEEIVQYTENDTTNNVLYLNKPLKNNHANNEPVDLLVPGAVVDTAGVWEQGVYWHIYQTQPKHIKVFIPPSLNVFDLRSASYIHGPILSPVSTTVAVGHPVSTTDTQIRITSAAGLPAAGMVKLNGTQIVFFIAINTTVSPPALILDRAIGNSYIAGTSVDLYQNAYAGTSLEDGNPRDNSQNYQKYHFPGPYAYDPNQRAPSRKSTLISTLLAPATRVASNQITGRTSLEVEDASLWSAPSSVQVGRTSGHSETLTLNTITSKYVTTTVAGGGSVIGATTLVGTSTGSFPPSNGTDPAGYRIIIAKGTVAEEIATIYKNDTGTNTFTVFPALTKNHAAAETIGLLNDVLSFDTITEEPHIGPAVNPSRLGDLVEVLVSEIAVVSVASFPATAGSAILNFGKKILNNRQKIVSITPPTTFQVVDSSNFPTSNFPYQVVLGEGTPIEEVINVSANAANVLTLASTPVFTHAVGEYIAFKSGDPEVVNYDTIDTIGNKLLFNNPIILETKHIVGEGVVYSPETSTPDPGGSSFAFKIPPNPSLRFLDLFDLVRAAGVQVDLITKK